MNIEPIKDRVLIKADDEEKKSDGGIILAEKKQPQEYGEVLAIGDEVTLLEVGDNVFFGKNTGQYITVDSIPVIAMTERDVQAVIG